MVVPRRLPPSTAACLQHIQRNVADGRSRFQGSRGLFLLPSDIPAIPFEIVPLTALPFPSRFLAFCMLSTGGLSKGFGRLLVARRSSSSTGKLSRYWPDKKRQSFLVFMMLVTKKLNKDPDYARSAKGGSTWF